MDETRSDVLGHAVSRARASRFAVSKHRNRNLRVRRRSHCGDCHGSGIQLDVHATAGVAARAMSFIAFMLLSAIAFGPGVFDIRFLGYLAEPMLLYGSGFGAARIDWRDGWHWLYNIAAPGLTLATVGWAAVVSHRPDPLFPRERLAALIFVSLAGLFLT